MQKQSLRFLPANKNPTGTRCIQIDIPDNDDWERDLYSEMYRLGLWMLWERDSGKNGTKVARLWRKAFRTWRHCEPVKTLSIGAEGEETLIRQNPDNPCELQSSVDGATWCTFADFSKCLPGSLQNQIQPPPQPQPQPGDCSEFDVTLAANGRYLLPVGVGAGDTVTITALSGGWYDGGIDVWRCPTGNEYLLGTCSSSAGSTHVGDPIPTISHMSLIATDGTNFYDARVSLVIDAGVVDGTQLTFQANDSDIGNNAGSASFHVKICKNLHPATFYYGLFTNFYAVEHLPDQIVWKPLPLGVPTTITSDIPADPSHPDNVRAYLVVTYAASFDSTNNAQNPGNVWYKMTAINVSGATFDGGAPYAYAFGSGCTGTGTATGQVSALPTVPQNILGFSVTSHTQFVTNITIEACS